MPPATIPPSNPASIITIRRATNRSPIQPPTKPAPPKIQTGSLPVTNPHLFGREEELAALNTAWESQKTNIVTIVAWGGVGKNA
ncbi:MAG: hypothetical protein ACLFPR_16715, partial [Desulfococcaceae bacterium]